MGIGDQLRGGYVFDVDLVRTGDGGFFVTWSEGGSLLGQRFSAAGAPIGAELIFFREHATNSANPNGPNVSAGFRESALLSDGSIAVAWVEFDSLTNTVSNQNEYLRVQVVNASGTFSSPVITVDGPGIFGQLNIVPSASAPSYVLVYDDQTGNPNPFQTPAYASGIGNSSGGFAQLGGGVGAPGAVIQHYFDNGTELHAEVDSGQAHFQTWYEGVPIGAGSTFAVSPNSSFGTYDSYDAVFDYYFEFAAGPGNTFAASWRDPVSGELLLQKFNNAASTTGPLIHLPALAGDNAQVDDIAILEDGRLVVVWTAGSILQPSGLGGLSPGAGNDIYAQVFEANGLVWGDPIRVNSTTNYSQFGGEIAVLGNNTFVVSFIDESISTTRSSDSVARAQILQADLPRAIQIGTSGDDSLSVTSVAAGHLFGLDGGANGVAGDTANFSGFGAGIWADLTYLGERVWTRDSTNMNSGAWRAIGDMRGIENLVGTSNDDYLGGDNGDNRFTYTGGRDQFVGRGNGATGDTADFSGFDSAIQVDLSLQSDSVLTRDSVDLTSGAWRSIADLSGVENLLGTAHADRLLGDNGDNRFIYSGGVDTLDGRGNTVAGDTADFSTFGSAIAVDFESSGAQVRTQDLPTLSGGAWRDLANLSNIENIAATNRDDMLFGDAADNRFFYVGGFDTLDGRGNGAFGDAVDFSNFTSAVLVDFALVTNQASTRDATNLESGTWRDLATLTSIEAATGSALDDTLAAAASTLSLSGGVGSDTLIVRSVNSGNIVRLSGGAGSDTADFSNFASAVWIDLTYQSNDAWTRDNAALTSGAWRAIVDLDGVENIIGTSGDDYLAGDAQDNRYTYNGGHDDLNLRGGIDTVDFTQSSTALWIDLNYVGDEAWTRGGSDLSSGTWLAIANLTNVENLIGTDYSDALYGNTFTRLLSGGAGDDALYVRGVQNGIVATYSGGANGAGGDTLDFSGFGAAVWVHLSYVGDEAWTRDNAGVTSGAWRAIGDVSGIENLTGSAFNDDLAGDGGANCLYYIGGFDRIEGAGGTDTVEFSRFSYAVWVDLAYAGVEAWTQDANQIYNGGPWRAIADLASIENLTGSSWNDVLRGDSNANLIQGGDGDDELEGRGGADTLHGGFGGFDTASYAHSTGPVTVNLTTNSASGGDAAGDSFISIEGIIGSAFNDNLTSSSSGSVLDGGLGADTLTGGAGADVYIIDNINDVIIEGAGGGVDRVETSLASYDMAALAANIENFAHTNFVNYAVTGNALDNTLFLYTAGLTLSGTFATINGGANGDLGDTLHVGDAAWGAWVDLEYSNHQVWIREYGTGPWRAVADVTGIENITDSSGNDYLAADGNANRFNYTGGFDCYDGRGGLDTADFSRSTVGAVWVNLAYAGVEAWSRDSYTLTSGTWRTIADLQNIENITGSGHGDFLAGDGNANILAGGAGSDTLTGGGGADSFLFDLPAQYIPATSIDAFAGDGSGYGIDTLTDFAPGVDRILLSASLFPSLGAAGALGAGHLVSGAGAVAADANDWLIYDSSTGALWYDPDGNGGSAAIQFASLSIGLALTNSDFLIV